MLAEDFAAKVSYEGGVVDALDYGLIAENIDEGSDNELRSAWAKLQRLYAPFEQQVHLVGTLLAKYDG